MWFLCCELNWVISFGSDSSGNLKVIASALWQNMYVCISTYLQLYVHIKWYRNLEHKSCLLFPHYLKNNNNKTSYPQHQKSHHVVHIPSGIFRYVCQWLIACLTFSIFNLVMNLGLISISDRKTLKAVLFSIPMYLTLISLSLTFCLSLFHYLSLL